jgi:hypothetical protein
MFNSPTVRLRERLMFKLVRRVVDGEKYSFPKTIHSTLEAAYRTAELQDADFIIEDRQGKVIGSRIS